MAVKILQGFLKLILLRIIENCLNLEKKTNTQLEVQTNFVLFNRNRWWDLRGSHFKRHYGIFHCSCIVIESLVNYLLDYMVFEEVLKIVTVKFTRFLVKIRNERFGLNEIIKCIGGDKLDLLYHFLTISTSRSYLIKSIWNSEFNF